MRKGEGSLQHQSHTPLGSRSSPFNPKQAPLELAQAKPGLPACISKSAAPVLPGAGRRALRAGVVGQLWDGAHRVPGGPYAGRAAATTGGTPARTLQLLTWTEHRRRQQACGLPRESSGPKAPDVSAAFLPCGPVWRQSGEVEVVLPNLLASRGSHLVRSLKLRWSPALVLVHLFIF